MSEVVFETATVGSFMGLGTELPRTLLSVVRRGQSLNGDTTPFFLNINIPEETEVIAGVYPQVRMACIHIYQGMWHVDMTLYRDGDVKFVISTWSGLGLDSVIEVPVFASEVTMSWGDFCTIIETLPQDV